MRLAKEIAGGFFNGYRADAGILHRMETTQDNLAVYVAAKLEPVRDVLRVLIQSAGIEGMECRATAALALLSEENK